MTVLSINVTLIMSIQFANVVIVYQFTYQQNSLLTIVGPHTCDIKVVGPHTCDIKVVGPHTCDIKVVGPHTCDIKVVVFILVLVILSLLIQFHLIISISLSLKKNHLRLCQFFLV